MDQELDLIAVQLVEEMRMDLNDIPYADEYKEQDLLKNHVRIQA